ncbi:MAG: S24/S26 family peptidase [Flavobacteriales bacterium]
MNEAPVILSMDEVKSLSHKLLEENKTVKLRLGGYSMFPVLLPGDIAVVEPITGLPKIGDVVVVALPEKWIAHRVVRVIQGAEKVEITTQGDSSRKPDDIEASQKTIGTISCFERDGMALKVDEGWRAFLGVVMVKTKPIPQIFSRLVLRVRRLARKLT